MKMEKKLEASLEELLPLVRDLTESYTGKESTSVTYETANMLMEAILYCLEEGETDSSLPMAPGGHSQAKNRYDFGYQLVLKKTVQAKLLYEDIIKDFDSYGNLACYDTVVKGMPEFFLRYDPKFQPQNHPLTLDYPILTRMETLRGVDAIWVYLNGVKAETVFLGALPREYVVNILESRYDNYKEDIMNLTVPILQNLLGFGMAEVPFCPRLLGEAELEKITCKTAGLELPRLEDMLEGNLKDLLAYGFPQEEYLFPYLSQHIHDFAVELKHGTKFGCLTL